MNNEYVHAEIGEEIRFISGYYIIQEERRMKYNDRELLVVIGHAIVDNSCCGRTGCRYALVPGYIVNWKSRKNDKGIDVTDVDPIKDTSEQKTIAKNLQAGETLQQVNF
ncbi:MAG: hypothetical protein NT056_03635 [Proteobacteria bacterium]|nr:hypothetical protein [Pseudomonadota bacterium]